MTEKEAKKLKRYTEILISDIKYSPLASFSGTKQMVKGVYGGKIYIYGCYMPFYPKEISRVPDQREVEFSHSYECGSVYDLLKGES